MAHETDTTITARQLLDISIATKKLFEKIRAADPKLAARFAEDLNLSMDDEYLQATLVLEWFDCKLDS